MSIADAIKIVIQEHGINAISQPSRFQALVRDYAGKDSFETHIFVICCRRGILQFAQKIASQKDEQKILDLAKKEKSRLEKEELTIEKYAITGVNMILEGFGFSLKLAEHVPGNFDMPNIESYFPPAITETNTTKELNKIAEEEIEVIRIMIERAKNKDIDALVFLGDIFASGLSIDSIEPIIVHENWRMAEALYRIASKEGNIIAKYKHIRLANKHK